MKNIDLKFDRIGLQRMLIPILFLLVNLGVSAQTTHEIPNDSPDSLELFLEALDTETGKPLHWEAGDIVMLTSASTYIISGTIDLYDEVTIMGDPSLASKPILRFYDNGFRPKEDSINITLKNLELNGLKEDGTSKAGYVLRFDQAGWYNYKDILIEDVEAYDFVGGVQLWKNTKKYYESVTLNKVYFHDMLGDYAIDPRLNAVEDLTVTNSTFANVKGFIKNVYNNNDGDGEFGSVAQKVTIDHNTFYNVLLQNEAFLQFNDGTDGSVTVDFTNNIVSTILDDTLARPFRINEAVGTVTISNNVFHAFESSRDEGIHNLEAVAAAQENVTASDIVTDDPVFTDPENGNYRLTTESAGYITDTQGDGYIGDPRWLPIIPGLSSDRIHPVPNDPDSLENFIENTAYWNPGDTILLVSSGTYIITGTIDFFQEITVLGDPTLSVKPELRFYDNGFRAKEDSINITLKNLKLNGLKEDGATLAPYVLRFDQVGWYNYKDILIEDVEAYNFNGGVQLWKNTKKYYESVTLNRVYFHDMPADFVIDPRLNVVEQLTITNSTFDNVKGFVKNVYNNNDGLQEFGTVPQNITIDHNTFYNVISDVFIQMNDGSDGSVTLTYTNNIVSTLLENTNSRPFRINEAAGTFNFSNSVFHNFESSRDGGIYNLTEVAAAQENVTIADISTDDPLYAKIDEAPYDFTLPLSSSLLEFSTTGGPIGDPRWFPEIGVSITELSSVVSERDEVQMEATVTFEEGADLSVTWSVINAYNNTEGAATIDASGLLTAETAGDVAVVAVSNFNDIYTDTLVMSIEPYIYVETISLKATNSNGTEINEIDTRDGSLTIGASVFPFDAPDKSLTWSLSDDALATFTEVNETSIQLTAVKSGTVTVTATANDGSEVTGTIDIVMTNQTPVTSITVSADGDVTEVAKGQTLQMTALIEPEDADVQEVEWSVSNESVATIDATGLLTGVAPGSVTVTADALDNSFEKGTFDLVVTNVLGAEIDNLTTLYPNPTTDHIHVNVDRAAKVQVMGMSGKIFLTKDIKDHAKLDVSALETGLYVLRVISGDEIQAIKFTKE